MSKAIGIFILLLCVAGMVGIMYGRSIRIISLELHMLLYFIFYFILLIALRSNEHAKLMIKFIFTGGVLVCIQYVLILIVEGKFQRIATYHADMFVLLIGLSVSMFAFTQKISKRLVAGGLSFILLVGLLISQTRAEWAASCLTIVVVLLMMISAKKIKVKYWLVSILLPLTIIGIVFILNTNLIGDIQSLKATKQVSQRAESFSNVGGDASLLMRVELGYNAYQRFRKYPILGAGLGDEVSYKLFGSTRIWSLDTSHLYILWKTGIVGFCIYVVMLVFILKRSYYVFKNTKDNFYRWYSGGLLAGFCGLILLSFFSSSLTKYNLNLVWATCLAVLEYGALQITENDGK